MHSVTPVFIVIAGPPGSGKSSVVKCDPGVDYFNNDDKAKELTGSYKGITPEVRKKVGKLCENFVHEHIKEKKSFCTESTLRTDIAITQAEDAKNAGFKTKMIFISTDSVEKNIERVIGRAQGGGHSAEETDVKEAYTNSFKNLTSACKEFDSVVGYDNSKKYQPPQYIFKINKGKLIHLDQKAPAWALESLDRAGLIEEKEIAIMNMREMTAHRQKAWLPTELTPEQQDGFVRKNIIAKDNILSKVNAKDLRICLKEAKSLNLKKGFELGK